MFCYSGKQDAYIYKPFLFKECHNRGVADYINKEIIGFLSSGNKNERLKKRDSKLERLLKHSTMVLETICSPEKFMNDN